MQIPACVQSQQIVLLFDCCLVFVSPGLVQLTSAPSVDSTTFEDTVNPVLQAQDQILHLVHCISELSRCLFEIHVPIQTALQQLRLRKTQWFCSSSFPVQVANYPEKGQFQELSTALKY